MATPNLPTLGSPTDRHLTQAKLNGIRSGLTDPLKLVDPTRDIYDDHYVVDSDVDLTTTNAAFRKALDLGDHNKGFMKSLNTELRGGPSYPIQGAILGQIVGLAPGGGTAWTTVTTAISVMKDSLAVQARPGDEIWVSEVIGMAGSQPTHQEQIWLIDPFRQKAGGRGNVRFVWVLHENRVPVEL